MVHGRTYDEARAKLDAKIIELCGALPPEVRVSRDAPGNWTVIRRDILERDGYVCHYCGDTADEVDHVVPLSAGGRTEPDNLVAACSTCNRVKADRVAIVPVMVIEGALAELAESPLPGARYAHEVVQRRFARWLPDPQEG